MKLYEVNQAIEDLISKLDPDPETGEVTASDDVLEQLHAMEKERSRILEYLAKLVLNCRSESASLKAEENRLAERRRGLERREDRLMQILDRECNGQKTDCGVATINYRATSRVEVQDSKTAISWLKRHKHLDCFRTPEPEVNKADVKKLLTAGEQIPGLNLVQDRSCSLK